MKSKTNAYSLLLKCKTNRKNNNNNNNKMKNKKHNEEQTDQSITLKRNFFYRQHAHARTIQFRQIYIKLFLSFFEQFVFRLLFAFLRCCALVCIKFTQHTLFLLLFYACVRCKHFLGKSFLCKFFYFMMIIIILFAFYFHCRLFNAVHWRTKLQHYYLLL